MTGVPTSGYPGQRDPTDSSTLYNAIISAMRTFMGRVATATLVKVQKVYPAAEQALGGPAGWVDVLPLVNMVDIQGNATPHGTVFGLPYFRLQGGAFAFIVDPVAGDIGMAGFASRDITSVKKNKAQSNPGSFRRFDMADGMYFGGFLNPAPTDYVECLADGGFKITDRFGNLMTTDSSGVTINGILFPRGGISFNVKTHTHDQPNDSHGDTEQPTNAPNDGS